jgi:hypothetical protein
VSLSPPTGQGNTEATRASGRASRKESVLRKVPARKKKAEVNRGGQDQLKSIPVTGTDHDPSVARPNIIPSSRQNLAM